MRKTYRKTQRRIEKLIAKWEPLLDLPGVEVTHAFVDTVHETDAQTVADTEAMWEYRQAHVRWFLGKAVQLDTEELEATLVHEYVHVLNAPIRGIAVEADETLYELATENMARALVGVSR